MARIKDFLALSRPHQFVKNGFIYLPLFFGYKLSAGPLWYATLGFFSFCLAASAVYAINDLRDVGEDRLHPKKRFRPIAAGRISPGEAGAFAAAMMAAALILGGLLPGAFVLILLAYLTLNVLYSLRLKHFSLLDVVSIALGFVLRVLAGGVAADVRPSHWIVLLTFLLALFLALGKRRDDLLLAQNGKKTRRCLDGYNFEFVSGSMVIMATVTIISYVMYTLSPDIVAKHGTDNLYLTSFWVIIGILRYLQISFVYGRSGSPTLVLLKDRFLQLVIILWMASFFMLLYVPGH